MIDQIFSYREMCEQENVQTLQCGMNFRLNPNYSVILMSRRSNAPYQDRIFEDGITRFTLFKRRHKFNHKKYPAIMRKM